MAVPELGYDFDKALKSSTFTVEDIELLREKVSYDAVPKSITDKQLLLFLNACGSIEDATKVIQIYYVTKKNNAEHFSNMDPTSKAIKQCLDYQKYFTLPPTEKENCPIVYHKVVCSSSNYFFDNAVKMYCMTMDAAIYKYGPRPGIIFLHDMQHVGISHMFRSNITSIRKHLHYLQYGLPAKVCRIHIFNVNYLFNKILTLVRPFLKKELLDIIHVHQSNMDYNEFYRDWIPKSHLPSDYGGDLKSVDELHDEFRKEITSMKDYFLAEEEQRKSIS